MILLDQEQATRQQIFDYFGYVEDWRVLPFDDCRGHFWRVTSEIGSGNVEYADTEHELAAEMGNYYVNEIYTNRHLPKWVYRGKDFTMIAVDTHTDGNQFLQIFSNANERPEET